MNINNVYCVIMAGGAGTRLWPVSRTGYPKQFIDVADTGKTFFRHTFDRYAKFIPKDHILVVTTSRYKDIVKQQVPELIPENILVEPYSRNTAPCIAYATYTLLKRDPNALMVVAPSDHIIMDGESESFEAYIKRAMEFAVKENVLMTLGIFPTNPDTNYGYLQATGGKVQADRKEALKVKTFTEKPDESLAKVFIDSGEFLWNSGIFVWKAQTISEEMEKYIPEVTGLFKGWEKALGSKIEEQFIERVYMDCIKISIDYAVMEKSDKVWFIPVKFKWFDIGAWESLYNFMSNRDEDENAVFTGKMLRENCHKDLIVSTDRKKLVAVRGLENYMVIDTPDVLLICPRGDKEFKDFIAEIAMPEYEKYR